LYRIATNCAYSALKRRRLAAARTVPLLEDDGETAISADGRPDPLARVTGQERQATLETALSCLPAKQQAAVVMRHVQELEYGEIAQALNCSEDSARANVYQGLKRLRNLLGEEDHFYEETRKK
jgi:RNA polymerase sigma-70 factor (ECF subfamily)